MTDDASQPTPDDAAAVERCKESYQKIRTELSKVIVGQDHVIEQVLIAMFARGHALLEGVPGLAKTLLISSIAESLHLSFKRIQFTPDLMPSDVTGAEVIQDDPETGQRAYRFLPGPVFANMLLADEINRTPPKTQAAMLEAMQERQVSAGGSMHKLPAPFFVLATQNPLEQEGTYPLPEAQLDRFLSIVCKSGLSERRRRVGYRPPGNHRADGQDRTLHVGRRHHCTSAAGNARAGERSGARLRVGAGACFPPGPAGNAAVCR